MYETNNTSVITDGFKNNFIGLFNHSFEVLLKQQDDLKPDKLD
ncbi:hypothetical protein [Flavobacterium ovatum]